MLARIAYPTSPSPPIHIEGRWWVGGGRGGGGVGGEREGERGTDACGPAHPATVTVTVTPFNGAHPVTAVTSFPVTVTVTRLPFTRLPRYRYH